MEQAYQVKSMVAEVAEMLENHELPVPRDEKGNPVQSSPPCAHQLHNQLDESEQEVRIKLQSKQKSAIAPQPPAKPKLKNSPLIEKLQANLALTPTTLLPSTKSPEVTQHTLPFCFIKPCGAQSPTLRPPQQPDANEEPVSFAQPAEGNLLSSFNKSRVRLSFKRRPPTRQHRKVAGEDVTSNTPDGNTSPCNPDYADNSPDQDSNAEDVLCSPLEEAEEQLKDFTNTVTEQNTKQQEEPNDVTQDNEEIEDSKGEKEGELTGKNGSDQSEAYNPVETQHDEKPCEPVSSEEMEGLKEEESTPIDESNEQQVQESEN